MILSGDEGTDRISVLSGGDVTIVAGNGDDVVHVSVATGQLSVDLGSGNDRLSVDSAGGNVTIDGEAGADQISITIAGADVTVDAGDDDDSVTITLAAQSVTVIGGAGDDNLQVVTAGADVLIQGGDGDDDLQGTDWDDEIYGGAGNDNIRGGGGADIIYGGAGDDRLSGGPGNDVIYGDDEGTSGDDVISGDAGDDQIFAGAGDDLVYGDVADGDVADNAGTTGADEIHGGAGDDRLFGGPGNDSLFGGADDDNLSGDQGADSVWGEGGNDVIHWTRDIDGDDTLLDGGAGADDDDGIVVTGNDSAESITASTPAAHTLVIQWKEGPRVEALNLESIWINAGEGADEVTTAKNLLGITHVTIDLGESVGDPSPSEVTETVRNVNPIGVASEMFDQDNFIGLEQAYYVDGSAEPRYRQATFTSATAGQTRSLYHNGDRGSFTLTYSDETKNLIGTTGPIAHDATAAVVENALNSLGFTQVEVSGFGISTKPWIITAAAGSAPNVVANPENTSGLGYYALTNADGQTTDVTITPIQWTGPGQNQIIDVQPIATGGRFTFIRKSGNGGPDVHSSPVAFNAAPEEIAQACHTGR